ncbi:uncharacterized protein BCR38DRAFT_409819 [Pseudomassariella vexata]|uniref:Uncharacterized protein n=1 Tax=Pseudomassariella vexata TaxID=1141098 RepID=A0A1Y2DYR9_9PEZI|nr:uncharacterized protein BCR38DRAFT_409819 [Pseudomassariella vexata]ORY64460.1 hypothetical protein BCR38DRAFT_409819 [Pseudomassariella vexata]
MAYNNRIHNAYADDRRHDRHPSWNVWRKGDPPLSRDRDGDRNRDYERERERDRDRSARRTSDLHRELRDRESDRGREYDNDIDSRRREPQLKVSIPDVQPRGTATSSIGSLSSSRAAPAGRPPPTKPAADQSNTAPSTPNPSVPAPPEARDPQFQELFGLLYQLGEIQHKRTRLIWQGDQLKKEMQRRERDAAKFGANSDRAADFPSVLEVAKQIKERDLAEVSLLEKRKQSLDQTYLQILEASAKEVYSLNRAEQQAPSTAVVPAASASSMSNLESKFAEFQKQFSQAQHQIAGLESKRQKSDEAIEELKSQNAELKSENAKLKEDVESLVFKMAAAESNLVDLGNNKASLADVGEVVTQIGGLTHQLELRQQEIQQIGNRTEEFETTYKYLSSSISKMDQKIANYGDEISVVKDKVENLDIGSLDNIVDLWISLKLPEKLQKWVSLELPEKLQSYDTQLLALRFKERETEATRHSNSHGSLGKDMAMFKMLLEEQGKKLENRMINAIGELQRCLDKSGDACATMVDDLSSRVAKLETQPQNVVSSRTLALTPTLETRISNLEKEARNSPKPMTDRNVETRLRRLEEQNLEERMNQEVVAIQQLFSVVNSNVNHVKADINNLNQCYKSHDLAIASFSEQINNIFTKPFADLVLKQLDSLAHRLAPRIDANEKRMKFVLDELESAKRVIGLLPQKRSASPSGRRASEDGSKRRRVGEVNGDEAPMNGGH